MNAFYRTSGKASPTDWKGMIEVIKAAQADQNRYLPIMTQYERQTIAASIGGMVEQYRPVIEGGALAAWNGAKSNLKAALLNVELQKRKITNSWDAGKLAPELQVYSMRVEAAAQNGDLAALKIIREEAQGSGDRYKQRACAEALQGLVNKFPKGAQDIHGIDARMVANSLEKQAQRDIEALQNSPELTQAHEITAAKVQELNAVKSLLFNTADVLGEMNPNGTIRNSLFISAIETVQQDDQGNFIIQE